MTKRTAILITLLLTGCPGGPPEGVYPCMSGHPTDCPVGWVCRADHLCWMHELDASVVSDGGSDAYAMSDAGSCVTETCNDRDDDCDGRVDEGLAIVGPPVTAGSSTGMATAVIISTAEGFGILCTAPSKATSWVPLDRSGAPLASVVTPGIGLAELSALASGTDVLVIGVAQDMTKPEAFVFSRASATHTWPAPDPYAIITANYPAVRTRMIDFVSGHATSYVLSGAVGNRTLRRVRIDATIQAPSPSDGFVVDQVNQFSALTVGSHELVVGFANEGTRLYRAVRGDAATSAGGETLSTFPSDGVDVSLASASSSSEVGTANPLGIAIARPMGSGVIFAEVTAVAPAALGAMITLPGSTGGGQVAVIAADTSGTSHHFFVAELRDILRVWDVDGEPPVARMLDVTGDWTLARSALSFAASGGDVRLAELDDVGEVVTRSIGCH